MSKKRKHQRPDHVAHSIQRNGRMEAEANIITTIVRVILNALDQVQPSTACSMVMHPATAHLWTVIAMGVAGAWGYFARRGAARPAHAVGQ